MGNITTETRPWGEFSIIYEDLTCKIKRITVKPGMRLSLQSHEKRDELWKHISGEGVVTFNSVEIEFAAKPVHTFNIQRGVLHRVKNTGKDDLVFIEIQTGDYFGEDDIMRFQDDYGRKS